MTSPCSCRSIPIRPTGFDAVWNGSDTDWSNPDNWSPRGVPDPTDRVYVSAAIPTIATLTRDVTVRDLFVEPGATVNTNGFNLTVTRNADAGHTIIGTGTDRPDGRRGQRDRCLLEPRHSRPGHSQRSGYDDRPSDARRGRAAFSERAVAHRRRPTDVERHDRRGAGHCRSGEHVHRVGSGGQRPRHSSGATRP